MKGMAVVKLLVIEKHEGYGVFPLFPQGTTVSDYAACDEYPHWCSCVIGGYETFVAEVYVDDGVLIKDYNPTEIIVMKGQILTLIHIVFEWLYVEDENGQTGWVPASKVISI